MKGRSIVESACGVACFTAATWLALPPAPKGPPAPLQAAHRAALPSLPTAPPTASYELKARLDATSHRVIATGTLHFRNTSRAAVRSLFLHLYLNAFKNERTLFLRSPFGAGRSGGKPREFGYVDVKRLVARELDGTDLWPGRVPHSPGDPEDETDIEVPLPRPLEPGEKLTLDVAFEAQLPEVVERTGYRGSFHFAGQWFPKLARLEPNGSFAHFAFHPQAEFYADFGRYDVTLDVPADFVVGATGARLEDRSANGRRVVRHVADGVHDFAWTAWDGFVEHQTRIGDVKTTLLAPRGHAVNRARTEATLRAALPLFSARYGAYPYPTLTVVHPPAEASGAGGMEYPTLITTGGPWFLPFTGARALEAVTVHELGHQWFYGLLASNEAKAPFLDEGVNSFAELAALRRWLGQSSTFEGFGLSIAGESLFRGFSADRGADEVVASPAGDFTSFQNLGALVYGRTAIVLETAARVYGREKLDRALASYAERFRFGHPAAEDFIGALRAELGDGAAVFVERALFTRSGVNFVLRQIENAPDVAPAGFFERPTGREKVGRGEPRARRYRSRVTVFRHGGLELPVEVLLIAADGARELRRWDGRGPHASFDFAGASPLAHAIVDPEHKILVDDDLFDNAAAEALAALPRVEERLGYFVALALGGLAP